MTRQAKLGDFVAKRSRGIVPASTPDVTFELYSVPAFEGRQPEVVTGSQIGSNKQIVEPGTVLLCKINPRINRAWTVGSFTKHQKIASTEWITFPPHPEVEPRYLAHYLSRNEIRDYLAANASGLGGSLMRVKASTVEDLPLPLPAVDEQRRIVAELEKQFSRLDEAVASLKRTKANLKRYKAAVLKVAVEGCLVPTEAEVAKAEGRGFETGLQLLRSIKGTTGSRARAKRGGTLPTGGVTAARHEFPQGWAEGVFGDLCRVQGGYAFKSADYVTAGVPLARISNLVNGVVQFDEDTVFLPEGYLARFSDFCLEKGDVLIALSGATTGKMATYTKDMPALLNQRVGRFRPTVLSLTAPGYIALLAAHAGSKVLAEAYGAAQPNISPTEIEAMPVGVPPLAEQSRIVATVERILSNVRAVEAQVDANLERAQALRQEVLAAAFGETKRSSVAELS